MALDWPAASLDGSGFEISCSTRVTAADRRSHCADSLFVRSASKDGQPVVPRQRRLFSDVPHCKWNLAADFEPVQGRIERALLDVEDVLGGLLNEAGAIE